MSSSDYYGFRSQNFITKTSLKVRTNIYNIFSSYFENAQKIADVGVTSEALSKEANVLEELHPHKNRITAIGIEDASHLEKKYPGLVFKRVKPNTPLPFKDNEFDVVYSHAVIEHIVDQKEREFFLSELLRIGKNIFVTTPNKYFLIELHTMVPLLHFIFPRLFYFLLEKKWINNFYNRSNLRLLSSKNLMALAGHVDKASIEVKKVKLCGLTSNLILIVRKTAFSSP